MGQRQNGVAPKDRLHIGHRVVEHGAEHGRAGDERVAAAAKLGDGLRESALKFVAETKRMDGC